MSESITRKAYPRNLNIIDPPVRERFTPHEQEHLYCLKETNHSNFFTKYLLQGRSLQQCSACELSWQNYFEMPGWTENNFRTR